MNENFTQFAFTETVKSFQAERGSRKSNEKMEQSGDRFMLTDEEKAFVRSRDGFYVATVGSNGWPYMQFRGGPPGFLQVIDDRTLAFADFRGNRQYITSGNVADTGRASLFLMDYPTRQRLKIWADAEILEVEDHPELAEQLTPRDYKASVERIFSFKVRAYDWNCHQHITPRYTMEELEMIGG